MDSHPTICFKALSPITPSPTERLPQLQLHLLFDSPPPSSSLEADTGRQVGEQLAEQAWVVERRDAHVKLFMCGEADLPGERGQLLKTQSETGR